MCGIAGILKFSRELVSRQELNDFSDPINHRGPDQNGTDFYNNNHFGFAHKRLSILDLSPAAAQPMKRYNFSIIYNGEVFNFIELREVLKIKGYQFTTNTDTEVILAAFKEWNTACFNKFNGMWAMAIYDHDTNTVILSRDRFGIKPLFYKHFGDFFAFASETNCFKKLHKTPRSFDHEILLGALQNPYSAGNGNKTIFDGILSISPGAVLEIDSSGITKEAQYYHFKSACAANSDQEYQDGEFRALFLDAVKLRLRSDVPIATAFSGGLDSTAVFSVIKYFEQSKAEISRSPEKWQAAFCMAFEEDKKLNDLPFALESLEVLKSKAHIIQSDAAFNFDSVLKDTTFYDDIIGTPLTSISPIYATMKKEGYSVSMDGHGADEYLFGYRNMVNDLFYNSISRKGKKHSQNIADTLVAMYYSDEQDTKAQQFEKLISSSYNLGSYFKRLLKNTIFPDDFEHDLVYSHLFNSPLPSLLKTFDKASMINGVEIRMPFMDYRLVELCYNLNINRLIGKGKTKLILREELADIIPKPALNRTYKIGIQAPTKTWISVNKEKVNETIAFGPQRDLVKEVEKYNITDWAKFNLQAISL